MNAAKTRYFTTKELATMLGVHPRTLENWRRDERGPAYIKDGEVLRYRETDVEAWLKSRLITTATQ